MIFTVLLYNLNHMRNTTSFEYRRFTSIFIVIGLIFILALLAVIFSANPIAGPATLPCEDVGSNVYEGYGDTPLTADSNLRRASDNTEINSETVENMTQRCKVDIAAEFGLDYLPDTRMGGGPLSTIQLSETHAYMFSYDPNVTTDPIVSSLFAIDRESCEITWKRNITDVSTEAAKMLLAKFPSEYNPALVETFVRPVSDNTCFGPITLYKNYLFTGTGCTGNHFFTDAYYNSRPQANGGPILGHTWGITNDNRHWMNGQIFVFDATTGQLLDADRLADAGEVEAQGYCNVETVTRMPKVIEDEDGTIYALYGSSHPFRRGRYSPIDNNETRYTTAIANGNREVRKGGVLKRFVITAGNKLEETWRAYGSPTALFAGDVNPLNPMQVFATDSEAEEYNYHNDGLWATPMVDMDRRQVGVSGGNGLFMPAELIIAAYTAVGTADPVTGAQGYPARTYKEWQDIFGVSSSYDETQAIYRDFVQSQNDRFAAMAAVPGSRREQFYANAFVVLDFDTGAVNWQYQRLASDTWISLTGQLFTFNDINDYPYIKAQYLGGGGDHDYPMGALRIIMNEDGLDYYVIAAKDGSVQAFNPDTGDIVSNTKTMPGQVPGGINYGGTTDGNGHVFFSGAWRRQLEFLADMAHISSYNDMTQEITVLPNPNCPNIIYEPFGPCLTAQTPLYSQSLIDVYDDYGNGDNTLYINQNKEVPTGAGTFLKVQVPQLVLDATAVREPANERTGTSGHVVLTSVNDVIFLTNAYGRIETWDPVTMTRIQEWDISGDVIALPGHPGLLICDNGVAIAGKEVWFVCGGAGFSGDGPGAFMYSYSL